MGKLERCLCGVGEGRTFGGIKDELHEKNGEILINQGGLEVLESTLQSPREPFRRCKSTSRIRTHTYRAWPKVTHKWTSLTSSSIPPSRVFVGRLVTAVEPVPRLPFFPSLIPLGGRTSRRSGPCRCSWRRPNSNNVMRNCQTCCFLFISC